jgi:hypothetical protein
VSAVVTSVAILLALYTQTTDWEEARGGNTALHYGYVIISIFMVSHVWSTFLHLWV